MIYGLVSYLLSVEEIADRVGRVKKRWLNVSAIQLAIISVGGALDIAVFRIIFCSSMFLAIEFLYYKYWYVRRPAQSLWFKLRRLSHWWFISIYLSKKIIKPSSVVTHWLTADKHMLHVRASTVSALVHWHTIQTVGNIFLQAFFGSACAGGQYKSSISTGGHLRAASINLLHRRLS